MQRESFAYVVSLEESERESGVCEWRMSVCVREWEQMWVCVCLPGSGILWK